MKINKNMINDSKVLIDNILKDLVELNQKYEYKPYHCKDRDDANKSFAIRDCIKIVKKYKDELYKV